MLIQGHQLYGIYIEVNIYSSRSHNWIDGSALLLVRGGMDSFKIALVFVLFAPVFHALSQSNQLKKLRLPDVAELPTKITRTRSQIPRYILDLYKQLASTKDKSPGRIIRAFFREYKDDRDDNNNLFTFDITTIKPSEKVQHASLRILKRGSRLAKLRGNFEITVYRLAKPWRKDSDEQWKKTLVYLDSKLVESRKEGEWIDFNVTSTVKYWNQDPTQNYGLWVSVRGIRVPSSDFHVAAGGRNDPFLVEFGVDQEELRNAGGVQQDNGEENEIEEAMTGNTKTLSNSACRLHNWAVDFLQLGPDYSAIVAPIRFNAKYCNGTCPDPLDQHLNGTTNHAVLQNKVHRNFDHTVPAACCVPNKLTPISVLRYASSGSIVLESWSEMVVQSCTCL